MIIKTATNKVKTQVYPSIDVVRPQSQEYNASGVPQGVPYGGNPVIRVFQGDRRIAYSTRKRSERYLPNSCDHKEYVKYYGDRALAPTTVRSASPHHADGWYHINYGLHGDLSHANSEVAALSALGVDISLPYYGLAQSDMDLNYHKLKPDLTKLSLPNFLLELDDVQKLWQQVKRNAWTLQKLLQSRAPSGSTAKTLAGNHLSWSYGVKPLFGDLQAMRDILENLMAKLEAFERMANQVSSQDVTIENFVSTKSGTFPLSGVSENPVNWSGSYTRVKKVGVVWKCLPLEVTKNYTLMLKVIFDALGFEANPRIWWDALPFTFVIDMFLDVGSWLEAHKHDTLELPVAYMGSYTSCKQTLTINSRLTLNYADVITSVGRRTPPGWVTNTKRFMRLPIAPSDSVFRELGWKLPTLNQAKLLFSLGTVLRRS